MSFYLVENNILGKTKPQINRQRVILEGLKTTPNKS